MKINKLDTDAILREYFANDRSYRAALFAVGICNQIIERYNAGDIVFEYEHIVTPSFELRFFSDLTLDGLYLKEGESTWVGIIGDLRDEGTPIISEFNTIIGWTHGKIVCSKREIREYFKLWRVAKITNVSKVTDLTK